VSIVADKLCEADPYEPFDVCVSIDTAPAVTVNPPDVGKLAIPLTVAVATSILF